MKKEYRDSQYCKAGNHDECPHWVGWSSRSVTLCHCSCHVDCPLRRDHARTEVWNDLCTCSGAARSKSHFENVQPRLEEQRRERTRLAAERKEKVRAVIERTKPRPDASESEIREQLARAYEEMEIEPGPGELELIAGNIRATNSPPGLKTLRAVGTLSRYVGQLVKLVADATEGSGGSGESDGRA
jgi:hypothetical protein